MLEIDSDLAQTQRAELVAYADNVRRLRQAGLLRPALHEFLLWEAGQILMALGQRMKERSAIDRQIANSSGLSWVIE